MVAELFGPRLKDLEIYFAGPAAMATTLQKQLHESGVDRHRVHFDEFY